MKEIKPGRERRRRRRKIKRKKEQNRQDDAQQINSGCHSGAGSGSSVGSNENHRRERTFPNNMEIRLGKDRIRYGRGHSQTTWSYDLVRTGFGMGEDIPKQHRDTTW